MPSRSAVCYEKKKKNWVYHAIVVYKKPIKLPPCIKIARYFHGERQKCFELLKFWHTSVFRLGVNSPLPHSKTLQIFFFVSDFVKSQVLQRTAFKMTKNLLCQLNIYIESLVYLRDGFVNILCIELRFLSIRIFFPGRSYCSFSKLITKHVTLWCDKCTKKFYITF